MAKKKAENEFICSVTGYCGRVASDYVYASSEEEAKQIFLRGYARNWSLSVILAADQDLVDKVLNIISCANVTESMKAEIKNAQTLFEKCASFLSSRKKDDSTYQALKTEYERLTSIARNYRSGKTAQKVTAIIHRCGALLQMVPKEE